MVDFEIYSVHLTLTAIKFYVINSYNKFVDFDKGMRRFSNVPQAWLEKVEEDKMILVQLSKNNLRL